jgi:hypothetical protein
MSSSVTADVPGGPGALPDHAKARAGPMLGEWGSRIQSDEFFQ